MVAGAAGRDCHQKEQDLNRVDPESNKMLADLDFSEELQGDDIRRCVLVHELIVNGRPSGLGITPFVPSKHLELPPVRIKLEHKTDEDGRYIEVSSDATARFVWLAIPRHDAIFSDNGFDLPAGRRVIVRIEGDVSPTALSRAKAYSLKDSY